MSLEVLVDLGCDASSHHSWSFWEKGTRSNKGHENHNGRRLEAIEDREAKLKARELKI